MYKLAAHALRDQFLKGEISATEIANTFLTRIETHDPELSCFLTVLHDRVRAHAKRLDEKRSQKKPLGKLAGIPMALKDNIHIMGVTTTCGSKFLSGYKAVFDATVTRLLEEEDALLIGKTNLDEFAMGSSTENSAYQITKNPWDFNISPGGSSGGSAAAVAARLSPIGFGSDTGGSIRQPAAFCGIVGFKPSYGRVSRYGLVAFGSSLDQIGPFTTNVQDAALIMEVIGKPCDKDATSVPQPQEAYLQKLSTPLKGMSVGVPWHFLENLEPEAKKNFEASVAVLKELGCSIIDIDLDILRYSIAVYYILATAEASTNLARFDGIRFGKRSSRATTLDEIVDFSRQEGFGEEVKRRIMLGTYVLSSGYQDAYYKRAQKVRTLMIRQFKKAFEKCHLILTPTSPTPAFELGKIQDPLQMYLQDMYTIPANLAGLPALSLPSGFCSKGRPFGLHFTGPFLHDADVLRAAHQFELKTKYTQKIPPHFEVSHG
ncbi:MAG TPA: Asp-tRNA(Asn)/Glu-tRNA(Gln) amidotransferase subunit GatA [Rhabdochlamydiaceae bacterium]|nr:Asp-tRNA(Asn)/Glu-tRNA(Gln) amidotransferase subunit GatA [Rhabdochlamydiaceae bacterium]